MENWLYDIPVAHRGLHNDEFVENTMDAFVNENAEVALRVQPLERVIDELTREIKNLHIERLKNNSCTIELGFVLSDLLTNYERISDHCSNIAVCFIEISHGSFETHDYLNHLKHDNAKEFTDMYNAYKEKYYIASEA